MYVKGGKDSIYKYFRGPYSSPEIGFELTRNIDRSSHELNFMLKMIGPRISSMDLGFYTRTILLSQYTSWGLTRVW